MIRLLPTAAAAGLALAFLTHLFTPAGAVQVPSAAVPLADYQEALEDIRQEVASEEGPEPDALKGVAGRLEQIRQVELPDGTLLPVDHAYLAGLLTNDPPQTGRFLANLDAILTALRSSADSPETARAELAVLKRILAGEPYQWSAPEPSPVEEFLKGAFQWMARLLTRLFPNLSDVSGLLNTALAAILAAIVAAVIFLVYRATSRNLLREAQAVRAGRIPAALTAAQALDRAQALSRSGDVRTAVRYLYLSALLGLEARGLLRIDRSRTNHEVLRDLSMRPDLAADLEEIIDVFDRVWYGFQAIDAPSFDRYTEIVNRIRNRREAAE